MTLGGAPYVRAHNGADWLACFLIIMRSIAKAKPEYTYSCILPNIENVCPAVALSRQVANLAQLLSGVRTDPQLQNSRLQRTAR